MVRFYILGAVLVAVALGAWHYRSVIADNKELQAVKKTDTATITALDNNAGTQREIEQTEKERTNAIRKTPQADNGSIAPILRRTLAGGM